MAYLKLFHGRASPDEQLDGWGVDGPIFGPFPFFHMTYGVEIKFDQAQCHALSIFEGLVFYGGMYYGDWSVFDGPPDACDEEFVVEFAPDLAELPQNGTADSDQASTPRPRINQTHVSERNDKEKNDMANEKKKGPVHEVALGRLKAAIWENNTTKGKRHNVTFCRIYKDGNDEWQDSTSFGRDDLLLLGKVADMAHTWIYEHGKDSENGSHGAESDGDESF